MSNRQYQEHSGWTGWIVFACVMMVLAGSLQAVYGLVAIVNDTWVGWNSATKNALVLDVTQWGWVHLIIGAILMLAGFGVMTGNVLARAVGVVVAGLSMIANFLFIPAYPLWSLTLIAVDLLVIWALTAHGGEMRQM